MKQFLPWTLTMACALAAGCRGADDGSEAKSLDNFARAGTAPLQQNQCSGEYNLMEDLFSPDVDMINLHPADGQSLETMQARVESALRAVPTELQVAFFGLGGVIEVTPLAHEICSQNMDAAAKARMSENDSRIKGCWKYQKDLVQEADGTYTEDPRVVMYIDADAGSIEHALVRTFGYVLSQVLVKLDYDPSKPGIQHVEGDPHFEAAKDQITLAFLRDVAASGGKYELKRFVDLLGADVVSADELARNSGWDVLKRTRPDAARAFADYVFAESFDSRFCSAATRQVMTSDFAKTTEAFEPVALAIGGLRSDIRTVDDEAQLDPELESQQPQSQPEQQETVNNYPATNYPAVDGNGNGLNLNLDSRYGLFGGFFRGIGRVLGGIARGVFRVGRALAIGAARIGAGILRVGAAIIRGTGRLALGFFRGAARVARGLVIGAGRILVGAARVTIGVGRLIVRGAGRIVHGAFGPAERFVTEPGMVLAARLRDSDGDGVDDRYDLCSNTRRGLPVHRSPQWMGCAAGQYRDRDIRGWR